MIDIKETVRIAIEFIVSMFGKQISSPMLEEVELSDDASTWFVTISYLRDRAPDSSYDLLIPGAKNERVYKTVKVNSSDGSVTGLVRRP